MMFKQLEQNYELKKRKLLDDCQPPPPEVLASFLENSHDDLWSHICSLMLEAASTQLKQKS